MRRLARCTSVPSVPSSSVFSLRLSFLLLSSLCPLYYYRSVSSLAAEILCRWRELRDAGLARRQDGVDDVAAVGAELVAVPLRDLVDQAMRAQQAEAARDRRGLPPLLRGLCRRFGEQQAPEVAVAKAVDGELAPV